MAAMALLDIGGNGTGAAAALDYVFERVYGSGAESAASIAANAAREDRYAGVTLAAMLRAIRSSEIGPFTLPPVVMNSFPSADLQFETMTAVSLVDPDYYPFFRPYGLFPRMLWYSFLSTVDLVGERPLGLLADRVAEGILEIVREVRDDEGLPFSPECEYSDFGLTALLVRVLYMAPVLESFDVATQNDLIAIRHHLLGWLLRNFDSFNVTPEYFDFTQAGTVSRLLVLPDLDSDCWHSDDLQKLEVTIADYIDARSKSPTARHDVLKKWWLEDDVDVASLSNLLDALTPADSSPQN
jgi:hypothetical protein